MMRRYQQRCRKLICLGTHQSGFDYRVNIARQQCARSAELALDLEHARALICQIGQAGIRVQHGEFDAVPLPFLASNTGSAIADFVDRAGTDWAAESASNGGLAACVILIGMAEHNQIQLIHAKHT